jgi:hypothetical protein
MTNYVMKTSFQYVDAVKTAIVFINPASAYDGIAKGNVQRVLTLVIRDPGEER